MKVNLCGLGEPLLNRHTPEFVRQIRDAGFECSLSTNGALLDEARAGPCSTPASRASRSTSARSATTTRRSTSCPSSSTRDNVVRFAEMAGDDCKVRIVLVDHRRDADHLNAMTRLLARARASRSSCRSRS